MIKLSQLSKEIYRPKDIARFVGVTTRTLENWEAKGKINFRRNLETNRRFLMKDDVVNFLKERDLLVDDCTNKRRDVVYARVSSQDQKNHGDLDRQIRFLIDQNNDLQNVLVLSEVGSGLNDNRKRLQQLLKMVMGDEVSRIFITYRDRLTRFGFHYIETMCREKGVEIVIMNQKTEKLSVEQELTEDLMALTVSFSGKLYGLRSKNHHLSKINDDSKQVIMSTKLVDELILSDVMD